MARRFSLEGKLALFTTLVALFGVLLSFGLNAVLPSVWLAILFTSAIIVPICIYAVERFMSPINQILQALNDGVASLKDSDFSISITQARNDELGDLIHLYNGVGEVLREERQDLFQRELLLDTVIQSTPIALLLCNSRDHVVYSNAAARQLMFNGKKLEGHLLSEVLVNVPTSLRSAIVSKQDGLLSVDIDEDQETYHLSCRGFQLNAQTHQLFLIKRLTKELNRREVATWKKVIRVISHELNNSLAPIASLAHSGSMLIDRSEPEKLVTVFDTIEERAQHLKKFIDGYARFAKLPHPRPQEIQWDSFVEGLQATIQFAVEPPVSGSGFIDAGQMEQVLINLIKNAHEAGSEPNQVVLSIHPRPDSTVLVLNDAGSGMSDAVLNSALLPFYSTKQTGTGLGLPLCREIVEAHGGRLNLRNRKTGGLRIEISLPNEKPSALVVNE